MSSFTHLHVHTQYSILDGASAIGALLDKAKADGQPAIAITDHGNMYGVKEFYDKAKQKEIKPILGCEAYVATNSRFDKSGKEDRSGDHLIILAKNLQGYKNLTKLASFAFIDGFYYKPRIDKELLEKYHEGLIITTACLGGEVPQHIMAGDLKAAEETVKWYKSVFGDDYYLELQRHFTGDKKKDSEIYDNQVLVNQTILELAKKYDVKVVATNDVHFINAEDAEAHDRLICLNTGKDLDDPTRMRYTMQEYLKSTAEMMELFKDIPEAITNTQEITDKIEIYKLDKGPVMPDFPLPEGFDNPDDYLKHIVYKGAERRYPVLDEVTTERIDFELATIKKMGFPGYFLIVWDFIRAAREELGVIVGPGRGSAAGSVVAYCIGITNIDPIKYDLLFERFLNPDRISMPDIDIDFDDEGRGEVLKWVVEKYGKTKVSHIITFGTMAAKMAIRDVARVQKLPLAEADRLSKLVPEGPGWTIKKAYAEVPELADAKNSPDPNVGVTLKYAETLEGSVRQTGVHACGIIICRDDLYEHIPVCTAKDVDLLITQYDGHFVEPVGMLKMDFLGLKTLTIIKETLRNIKRSKGIDVDIDKAPLDDEKTFQLYSNGETTALFQFESPGMKKHLRNLQPNRFEDLVAMNALYRPGPMDYIPQFVNRKHGREPIVYDHPLMEPYLNDTYGITVYQEQVMLQSRALANFTRGESDSLRKAMGKKQIKMMNELKLKFVDGCKANPAFVEGAAGKNMDELIDKIWGDWESFAKYAFNKSHSVCYAYVSYQTAYLKAHYPAEFMAAVLSCNLSDIKKITIFMEECKRMGLPVLGPDVNESHVGFSVNKKGAVRFGMSAIKGIGEAAVNDVIREVEENGPYKDIYDFAERVNFKTVGRKAFESFAIAGAFDEYGFERHQYFATDQKGNTFIETLMKYGQSVQQSKNSSQQDLFGAGGASMAMPKPQPAPCEKWSTLERLNKERDLVGIYLSAHPLDDFRVEIDACTNMSIGDLDDLRNYEGKEVKIAGMVSAVEHRMTKTGKPMGSLTVEDYNGTLKMMFFSNDYSKFKEFMTQGSTLFIKGKVQPRPYGENRDLEFKVESIMYLDDVKDKMLNSVALKIPVTQLNEKVIYEINSCVEKHKGSAELKFLIYDPENEKNNVFMTSRIHRVRISNELVNSLGLISEIEKVKIA